MIRLLLPTATFLVAIWPVHSSFYEALAVAFSVYSFQTFFSQISQRVAVLECAGAIATFEILLIPAVTYWVFPASMPIESDIYFRYALPACVLFYVGISGWANPSAEQPHRIILSQAAQYLQHRQAAGISLFCIGLAGFIVKRSWPEGPSFMGTLPMNCLLTSALYGQYAKSAFRIPLICVVVAVLLMNTIQTGMFGELFFWSLLGLLVSSVGLAHPLTVRTKITTLSLAFGVLLLIQSIKGEYRHRTWGHVRTERSADPALMADLVVNRLTHPEKLLNAAQFFRSFVRFNQGIMIGSAMTKVPVYEDYADGEVLLSFLSPFVPRFIWASKPLAGGFENIRRYTSLPQFDNTSMNLSPIGEGYANFGYGGLLFAWFYGVVLRSCFQAVFRFAGQMPSVVLWIPMLFIGCLTMETDVFSTWGSLVNSALFIALLYWILKRIGIDL
ncbi:hypothetical protein [Spirosoma gilvum]